MSLQVVFSYVWVLLSLRHNQRQSELRIHRKLSRFSLIYTRTPRGLHFYILYYFIGVSKITNVRLASRYIYCICKHAESFGWVCSAVTISSCSRRPSRRCRRRLLNSSPLLPSHSISTSDSSASFSCFVGRAVDTRSHASAVLSSHPLPSNPQEILRLSVRLAEKIRHPELGNVGFRVSKSMVLRSPRCRQMMHSVFFSRS